MTTVRSPEKGAKVLDAHASNAQSKNKLSYQIVKDVAQKGAFDDVSRPFCQESWDDNVR